MENNNSQIDLAKDTFVEKIPGWLRWVLLIPVSIIAPILLTLIMLLVQSLFVSYYSPEPDSIWSFFMRSALWGGVSTYTACLFATKYQKIIAIIYLILFSLLSGANLFSFILLKNDSSMFISIVETIGMLGGAAYVTYFVNNELN